MRNLCSFHFLIVMSAYVLFLAPGSLSLKCHVCSSKDNDECDNDHLMKSSQMECPYNSTGCLKTYMTITGFHYVVDPSKMDAKEKMKYEEEMDALEKNRKLPNNTKIDYQFKTIKKNTIRINRNCTNAVAEKLGCKSLSSTDGKLEAVYCFCTGDVCNSASGLSSKVTSVFLGLVGLWYSKTKF